MSEEEKKAIDYLKNDVVYWLDKGKDFVVIDIGENKKLHSILNLIEKQQKEIEEMREELQMYVDVQNNNINNYISKDKIREKIEELESLSKNITMQPSIYNYEIDLLEELLEENNEKSDTL